MLTAGQERMLVLIFALVVAITFILPVSLYDHEWPRQPIHILYPLAAVAVYTHPALRHR